MRRMHFNLLQYRNIPGLFGTAAVLESPSPKLLKSERTVCNFQVRFWNPCSWFTK